MILCCPNCWNDFQKAKGTRQKYCSNSCAEEYNANSFNRRMKKRAEEAKAKAAADKKAAMQRLAYKLSGKELEDFIEATKIFRQSKAFLRGPYVSKRQADRQQARRLGRR